MGKNNVTWHGDPIFNECPKGFIPVKLLTKMFRTTLPKVYHAASIQRLKHVSYRSSGSNNIFWAFEEKTAIFAMDKYIRPMLFTRSQVEQGDANKMVKSKSGGLPTIKEHGDGIASDFSYFLIRAIGEEKDRKEAVEIISNLEEENKKLKKDIKEIAEKINKLMEKGRKDKNNISALEKTVNDLSKELVSNGKKVLFANEMIKMFGIPDLGIICKVIEKLRGAP